MGAFMGMAGLNGMLRRHMYFNGEYYDMMILAAICGSMLLAAWLIFLFNIIMSVGLKGLIGIFMPSKNKEASYGI
jgi:cytochrome c oxidase subunit 1